MAKKRRSRGAGSTTTRDASPAGGSGRRRRAGPDRSRADDGPALPRWLPALVFVGLGVVLFRSFIFSDRMLYGGDTVQGIGYVARAFYADALSTLGAIPDWAPLILGGTPFLEGLSGGDSLYPPSLVLLLLMATHRALGWKLVVHFIAAGFFMYGWLRSLDRSRAAALLGGVGYMSAPYFVSLVNPGHDGKIFVTALAPLLFWAVERHFIRPGARTVASIALVVGLVILTTHFQMAYFLFGAVGLFALFRAAELALAAKGRGGEEGVGGRAEPDEGTVSGDRGGGESADASSAPRRAAPVRAGAAPFGLFLLGSVLGAGVSAVQLLPAVDYVTEYSRRTQTTDEAAGETGRAWSTSWSLHPEDVMALVIPEFSGNNSMGAAWSQGTYWGRNATKDNHESAGLVVLLLAVSAFVGGARRHLRYFLAGLGLLVLLFGLGEHTPVWSFFYAFVPGIRMFRAPGQAMFLFAFAVSTLAALGLDRILALGRSSDDDAWPGVLRALLGITAGLAVLAVLASSGALTALWTAVVYPNVGPRMQALESARPFIAQGAGISLFLSIGLLAAVWAFRFGRLAPGALVAVLSLLVAVDELRISAGFVQTMDFYEWSAPDGFVQAILEAERGSDEPYRLLSFRQASQDVRPALAGIELAAGHHPNDLARYRELIGMVGSGNAVNLVDPRLRRLLNVRYVLWPDFQLGEPPMHPQTAIARSELPDGRPYETLHLEAALPRARLVGQAVVRPDDEAVAYMLGPDFDPETEVVLTEPPPIRLDGSPATGSVEWIERSPNRLELAVRTERPALLVIADNWFPAWHATVDGSEAPVLRAYHTLRAVPVPAGEHTVEMLYRSEIVQLSLWLSVVVTLGVLGALIGPTLLDRRREKAS